ncbi:putative polygalacturonase [Naematelia encephala]|uniref:galacturonan 1,4-alpha-galacturonidase n=1 Tax=Naematelia encephala TaxID=71784 RepID=A0A1Y2B7G5_9TREE|nr:putative polygalacturonase [Naematelia encephala]
MRAGVLSVAFLSLGVGSVVGSAIDLALAKGHDILEAASQLIVSEPIPPSSPLLEIDESYFDVESGTKRKLCVLHPKGGEELDDDNFKAAFEHCGNGGIIRLPDANYTIGSPLTTELNNAILDVHGWISFSSDIDHWVAKRVPFEFQNLALAWIIKGTNYVLEGNGKGGIYGNGDVWYNWAKDEGNKYGRPMSFAISDSKNVVVRNWSVIQPQFWASIVIRSENVLYKNYYVNATQYNPEASGHFLNWLQNTDGCDTYKSHNVTFEDMVYQGGDDCLALKPNSSMIRARNVTCFGGTGIAFGSIGQYKGIVDYIDDVEFTDITLLPSSQHLMKNGLYFKSWMGYEIGTPPNGGGGGSGYGRDIKVDGVKMKDVIRPIYLQSDLTYLNDHRGEGHDTGLFHWSNISLSNISGTSALNRVVWLDCSKQTPCKDITFDHVKITPGKDDAPEIHYVCNNVVLGGGDGLDACHPSDSQKEGAEEVKG